MSVELYKNIKLRCNLIQTLLQTKIYSCMKTQILSVSITHHKTKKKKREKKQTVNFLKRCSFKKCAQLPQCFVVSTQRQP